MKGGIRQWLTEEGRQSKDQTSPQPEQPEYMLQLTKPQELTSGVVLADETEEKTTAVDSKAKKPSQSFAPNSYITPRAMLSKLIQNSSAVSNSKPWQTPGQSLIISTKKPSQNTSFDHQSFKSTFHRQSKFEKALDKLSVMTTKTRNSK